MLIIPSRKIKALIEFLYVIQSAVIEIVEYSKSKYTIKNFLLLLTLQLMTKEFCLNYPQCTILILSKQFIV